MIARAAQSRPVVLLCLVLGVLCDPSAVSAQSAVPEVLAAEQARVDMITRIAPSVVAIFPAGGGGGGSGVLVSADGYALSNFHVTEGESPYLKCGLNNGVLYDAVVVGHDPTGDVSLIKMIGRSDFPFAVLGDSDRVRVGDWTYVLGNPFLLATDFQPTVTYGIVSGVQRYQYPAAKFLLEYTDCIQVDTSINPGNSGGPLFNAQGELIGINGRGSFEKRGRVNSGAGYAISINQIKHFWDQLRSGRIVDHGTLGASLGFNQDGEVVVLEILESSDAFRAGLREDDEIVSFGGRSIGTPNQFKNVLGIYPEGRKVPLVYRRDGERREIWARLSALHRREELIAEEAAAPPPKQKQPGGKPGPDGQPGTPQPPDKPAGPGADPHAAPPVPEALQKLFAKRSGYANYYFNQVEQTRLLPAIKELGSLPATAWTLNLTGKIDGQQAFQLKVADRGVGVDLGTDVFLQDFEDLAEIRDEPPGTGSLLGAIYHWRRLVTQGPAGFTEWYYEGSEPLDGRGELVDVLIAELGGARSYWFISRSTQKIVGYDFERTLNAGRCEVRIESWKPIEHAQVPGVFRISFPGQRSQNWTVESLNYNPAP